MTDHSKLVLVTGGSGFVASYCIARLLRDGYPVRTTVRSEGKEWQVRDQVATAGAESAASLSFVVADLTDDAGWARAMQGCRHVLHVASPFPLDVPADEDELITPAREGTLRVLRAATEAGVERVVITSSFAAVGYTPMPAEHVFTEADWTDADTPGVGAYRKSKVLAERAAWDYVAATDGAPELSVINPTGIFGPVLGPQHPPSIEIIDVLLRRAMPAVPKLWLGVVDVRDLAALHVAAMTAPEAAGERFLAVAGPEVSLREVARFIKSALGERASKVPTLPMPSGVVRLLARVARPLRQIVPELDRTRKISNDKAREVLGWTPRPIDQTLLDTARSLLPNPSPGGGGSILGAAGIVPRA